MAAPNAPNPVNPNDQNQVQNQDQNQDHNQDQVPAGQVPAHVPVPQLGPSTTGSCWCHACSSDYLSELDR